MLHHTLGMTLNRLRLVKVLTPWVTRRLRRAFATLLAGALTTAPLAPAHAQRLSFIRDAEIENTIRTFATPVFNAAGLNARDIRVHLVNDPTLNAFVAGGMQMFLNTGLLIRTEHAGQVVGVIAHEAGHVTGGHLARFREQLRSFQIQHILAAVLGTAAAVGAATATRDRRDPGGGGQVGGNPMALPAIATGMVERSVLAYSRDMEQSADQAAVQFLDRARLSARGLGEFLRVLAEQELLRSSQQDAYLRTHPISRDRVDFVERHLAGSRYKDASPSPAFIEMHQRMRAKLLGFLDPARALSTYREGDNAIAARYARAIAYSRRAEIPRSLALLDSLLRDRPNDPYFLELKGQILLEASRPREAIPYYERALRVLPEESLILTALAHAQIESNRPELLQPALATLERSRRADALNGETWRLLAIAYSRANQPGQSSLASAELSLLRGDRPAAKNFAERAIRELPPGTPAALRAEDIREQTDQPRRR
jgi:predicted Zn-dependent protease